MPVQVRRDGQMSEFLTSSGLACIGTPDDCIKHFERLWLGSNGGFGAVLLLAHNWADWEQTKKSYELYARFVMPHFAGTNRNRQESYAALESNIDRLEAERTKGAEAAFKAWEDKTGRKA